MLRLYDVKRWWDWRKMRIITRETHKNVSSGWQMIVLTRWKAAAKREYLCRAGQTHFVLLRISEFVGRLF